MQDQAQISNQPDIADDNAPPVRRSTRLERFIALALHPFLFAAASVFSLYAPNLHQVYFSDVAIALAAALGAALVLFLAFGAALKNFGAKAGILASAALAAGLFYSEIINAANRYLGIDLSSVAALPIILAILAIIIVAVAWSRIDFTPANVVLNGIAFVLFIFPAWQVASHEWRAGGGSLVAVKPFDQSAHAATDASLLVDPAKAQNAPDIYYFIFDRYGSQSTLADYYGFDNSDLIDFLKAKGFYVASDSHSNYLKTAHSVASTFHMGFLDFLREDPRSKIGDWHPIYDRLRDHRVGRFLKSNGYEFIQIGAWWGPTQHNPFADENYSFAFGEFDTWYLRKSIISPVLDLVAPASTYARRLQWDLGQCQRVPRQIEKAKEIGERNENTFVFAHILVPHDPYVFSPDGHCLPFEEAMQREQDHGNHDEIEKHQLVPTRDRYIDQVRYANSLIKDFVSAMLAKEGAKPIIIIQADEGPLPKRYNTGHRSWREATDDELKIKTGILNAYYFPDGDYRDLDQHVTSVNTFRILFNKYFGTRLERLPDRVFAFPDYRHFYDFYDITDIVSGDPRQMKAAKDSRASMDPR
jgi:hypothetical protein